MILRTTLPDGLGDAIERRAADEGKAKDLLVQQLLRDAMALPRGRMLALDAVGLEQLEKILGGGSVLNQQDLALKVQRLAGITYGNIRLDFTPSQLEEIARRAERLSLTPEELVRRTAQKMEELFFTHLGTGMQHGV